MKWLPKPEAVVKEAATVIGGAVLAYLVVSHIPVLKEWLGRQLGGVTGT